MSKKYANPGHMSYLVQLSVNFTVIHNDYFL